jgi:carboxyl-terminal processing protease
MAQRLLRRSLAALFAASALAAPPASAELVCNEIPQFVRLYLRQHVLYNALIDELEQRAIENFVLSMDRSRSLLTEPEEQAMRASLAGIFEEIEKGRCSRLIDVHKQFVRAHEAAAKYVRAFVSSPDYAIDETSTLVLDPEERGYPKTAEVRDDLLRRMVHFQMSTYVSNGTELAEAKDKLIRRYERRFKRGLETPQDEIHSAFLDAFASALDPHSNYLSARVLEDFQISMSLSLEGIGVALSEQDGYAVAERIIPGGAADRQGTLRPQDKIIAVSQGDGDFVDIIDMPLRDAVSLIRGKAGTSVGLTILRQTDGKPERFNVTIVRDQIDLAEQAAKLRFETRKVDGRDYKLAILDLPSFYGDADPTKRQCPDDVAKLLEQAKQEGADGLLLDLSRNGGGLLQHAVTISGFFIREGDVVGIQDSEGRRKILSDPDGTVLYNGPMVVHTSRVSASAAEILAGALRDYGRAVIVGDDHTFGKGTVQTVSQLPGDNGALKITTALYFRPGGLSTQHSGVDAHVVLPSLLADDDYGEKTQRYSLPPQSTTPFLSRDANSADGVSHWEPVEGPLIARLAERSAGRVAADTAFVELRERMAEAQSEGGVVALSEILKRRGEAGVLDETEAADEIAASGEEAPPTPQLEEALRVLTDLVTLSEQSTAARDASRPES